jgi:K+-transporting ATPase A subunit
MPQLVTVKVNRPDRRPVRVWVPVLPVALVLLPVVVLVVLAAIVACVLFRIGVVRALGAAWRVISALPGARFDIEQGRTAVLVAIR